MDVKPGLAERRTIDDGDTIPVSQTSAPVQIDQVLGTLQSNTRKDLQDLWRATAMRSTASRSPARTTTRTRT